MFTGIIQTTGKIISKKRFEKGYKIVVSPKKSLGLSLGDSVAVNGVCLTVAGIEGAGYLFDISSETAVKTTISNLKQGELVNLEPAMKVSDAFGGHMVSGHVDGTGKVIKINKEKADTRIKIQPPDNVVEYIVDQGSVAVDGVSLTVASRHKDNSLDVVLIPHTLAETNLSTLKPGAKVNVEADMIGKYIKKYVDAYMKIRREERQARGKTGERR